MNSIDLLSRISIDPNICFSKLCIKGHRIWVASVLGYLAVGKSIEGVLEAHPSIQREDVLVCIAYGAEMARGGRAEVPFERLKETVQ